MAYGQMQASMSPVPSDMQQAQNVYNAALEPPPLPELEETWQALESHNDILREIRSRLRGLQDRLFGPSPENVQVSGQVPTLGGMMGKVVMATNDAHMIAADIGRLALELSRLA